MRRALWTPFLAVGFCMSSLSIAQYKEVPSGDAEREMCKAAACAFNVHVALKQKDGSSYDKMFSVVPILQPIGVSVYAGQTVLFEADIQGDQLTSLKLVKTVEHPGKTLSASLEQEPDTSMMLIFHNPFDKNLKITVGMMPLDQDRLLKTSSCPVLAQKTGVELWPYPIFQVVLGNMRLLSNSSELVCSE